MPWSGFCFIGILCVTLLTCWTAGVQPISEGDINTGQDPPPFHWTRSVSTVLYIQYYKSFLSKEIFHLNCFSLFKSPWAIDHLVKIFSILVRISQSYSNFRFKKLSPWYPMENDLPGYENRKSCWTVPVRDKLTRLGTLCHWIPFWIYIKIVTIKCLYYLMF